jgi:hypothetical protein
MAVHPIDRPRSSAFDGPPAMDMCAPSNGNDSSFGRGLRPAFGLFAGGIGNFLSLTVHFWREDFQTVCIDSFTLKQALK